MTSQHQTADSATCDEEKQTTLWRHHCKN